MALAYKRKAKRKRINEMHVPESLHEIEGNGIVWGTGTLTLSWGQSDTPWLQKTGECIHFLMGRRLFFDRHCWAWATCNPLVPISYTPWHSSFAYFSSKLPFSSTTTYYIILLPRENTREYLLLTDRNTFYLLKGQLSIDRASTIYPSFWHKCRPLLQ